MPYVSRDDGGNITGTFAKAQPGFAEEYLADDDPEVVAFVAAQDQRPPPVDPVQDVVLYDHENRLRSLEGVPPLSIDEFRKLNTR